MPQTNWVIAAHFILLWVSVLTSVVAGWRLPISNFVAVPLGVALWAAGFIYNLYNIQRLRSGAVLRRAALIRKAYQRVAARTIMNLGIGLAFRSWLTLVVSVLLIFLYVMAANKRLQYIDYLRSGMLDDAFPDRISKH